MSRFVCMSVLVALFLCGGCAEMRVPPDRGLGSETGPNYAVVNVFFATDRQEVKDAKIADRFTGARGELAYGLAKVSIPRNHKMGVLEAPSVWKLEFRANPEKHVVLTDLETLSSDAYYGELSKKIKASGKKSALIFVHGYNVTFEDAARRTAQISYDLRFDGAPIFYSWPSQGALTKYTVDESNVAWSTSHMERFLSDFAEKSDAERIYLIGHSMGTRALTQAYLAVLAKKPVLKQKFVEVILAAPDMDADVFKSEVVPKMVAYGAGLTLYASSKDVALMASNEFHGGYPRAGESGSGIVVSKGLETIDATEIPTDFLNHSYVAENRSILSDVFYILTSGTRANDRAGLLFVSGKPQGHWQFKP